MDLIAVVTTVGRRDLAVEIARALIDRRLAACAQIDAIDSVYRWDGTIRHEPEHRLWLKTTAGRYAELEAALRALHPYELPQILALPVTQALPAYADWVAGEVAPAPY